jgi:hypothetical protein
MKKYTLILLLLFTFNTRTNTTSDLLLKITGASLVTFGVVNLIDQYKKKNYSWKKSFFSIAPLICGALCFPSVRTFSNDIFQSIYKRCHGTSDPLQKNSSVKNIPLPQLKRIFYSEKEKNDIIVLNNRGLINTGIFYTEMNGNQIVKVGPKGFIELDATTINNCSNSSLELKISTNAKTSINNHEFTLQPGNYQWNGIALVKSS